MNYLFNRLKEPSTYAGLAALAYVAQGLPSILAGSTSWEQIAVGIMGLLAVALGEGNSSPAKTQ